MIRSFLFVPGDSERKLLRGMACGADALILDLEDSVSPAQKPRARAMVAAALASRGPELWVRINPLDAGGLDDLAAVMRAGPHGIVVPKVDGPADVQRLSHYMDALERRDGIARPARILPVATETARAPFHLGGFADAGLTRLYGLTWGAEDLSAALGASTNRAEGGWAFTYRMARSLCLLAAKAAGVEPIETVFTDIRDAAGHQQMCEAAAAEGFTGCLAIHPDQVPVINQTFMPSASTVAHATRVLAAFAAAPGAGAVSLDGMMLDRPHIIQAEGVLARHAAFRSPS